MGSINQFINLSDGLQPIQYTDISSPQFYNACILFSNSSIKVTMMTASRMLQALVFLVLVIQVLGQPGKKDPRKKIPPRKKDVKKIACSVCSHLSRNLFDTLSKQARKKGMSEESVIDSVEKSTTAWREQGEWITHLHLEKTWKGYLGVKDMKKMGECGEACRTIEYAAQQVMGEHDADVGEALYTGSFGSTRGDFERWLCDDLTRACANGKDFKVEDDFVAYPKFEGKDPKEQNIERVLGEMADQGLRGNMFTREEAMEKYMAEMGEDPDDFQMPTEL